jgi:phosphatidate cytidylyltransferase
MKRGASVKDSSAILPGHGGLLDRVDGTLFTLPVLYVCLKLVA